MTRARVLAVMLLTVVPFVNASAQRDAFEGPDYQARRRAWFEEPRAYPNTQIDWEARIAAKRAFAARTTNFGSFMAASSAGSWIPMGPSGFFGLGYWDSGAQLDAGRVDAIAIHPTSPSTMVVASPNGGLWRTTSSGGSWSPVFDTQCSLQMSTVRFDPVNPSIVYAGAADGSGAAGCALFRSTDGGVTWGTWNGGLNFTAYNGGNINALFVDPATAGTTTSTTMFFNFAVWGLYRSTNSGQSWAHVLTFGYVTSIVALPGRAGTFFAGVSDRATTSSTRSGLYRSDDNGATWVQVTTGSGFATVARFQLAVSASRPGSVWILAGEKTSRAFSSFSRWDDGTATLTTLAAGGIDPNSTARTNFGKQAEYDLALVVDPSDASRIYVAGVRAFRSTDGGVSFAPMGTEIHCDWHALEIDPLNPRRLFAGTDGGVFVSVDGGDSWLSRNMGLVISMFYPGISQHPTDVSVVLGGTQDNGSLLGNGTSLFGMISGGDGGYAAINPLTPSVMWSTIYWQSGIGATIYRRSLGAGGVPVQVTRGSGISASDRALFIPPMIMDPLTPTTLYFGTQRLHRTTNEGLTWTPVSGDLSKGSGMISAIAVAPSDALSIYVGTSDGNLNVSRDAGVTWRPASLTRAVTDFAVDYTDPRRAVATVSGSGAAHVYLTTDAGTTWTSISANLPDMPANAAVIADDSPNHIFVGNDVGVFETTDGGLTWTNTPSGLPNVIVNDLSYNRTTKQLVAATYGRGLFRYSLVSASTVLRGDVNRDGVVNAADALLVQQALLGLPLASGLTISPHGDADCNGRVELADALVILRYAVGTATAGACVGTNR